MTLRAVADLHCAGCSEAAVAEDLKAAVRFAVERYSVPQKTNAELITWVLLKIHDRQPGMYRNLVAQIIYDEGNGPFARALLATGQLKGRPALEPARYVFSRLCEKMRSHGIMEEIND